MDYNPLHRDRLVQNWILEQSIERMKCPECLCDMHPTYHAWDTLGRRVSDWPRSVLTIGELETALVKKRMKLGHNLVNHHSVFFLLAASQTPENVRRRNGMKMEEIPLPHAPLTSHLLLCRQTEENMEITEKMGRGTGYRTSTKPPPRVHPPPNEWERGPEFTCHRTVVSKLAPYVWDLEVK
ncbi:hypothetical protein AVEN_164282-1 [Araneus ventricosus]|uniref:Uncharacterized protein n=1 Tax=Araneus ventricosus TaxID=182803 RepID=A0A4Y2H186_ARAVE|nr:hypothetical protein AVEN_164282-1 [Araneus ventricosus]